MAESGLEDSLCMPAFLTRADLEQRIGSDAAEKLSARGVPSSEFEWLLPAREVRFRGGEKLNNLLCGLAGGRVHIFPHGNIFKRLGVSQLAGAAELLLPLARNIFKRLGVGQWEVESIPLDMARLDVQAGVEFIVLGISAPSSSRVEEVQIVLDEASLSAAVGSWLHTWGATIGKRMGFETPSVSLGVINRRDSRLAEDDFGLVLGRFEKPGFCGIAARHVKLFPGAPLPSLRCRGWMLNDRDAGSALSLLIDEMGFPAIIELIEWPVGGQCRLIESFCELLSSAPRTEDQKQWKLDSKGLFYVMLGDEDLGRTIVRIENDGLVIEKINSAAEERMDEAWTLDDKTAVLANRGGLCAQVLFKAGGAQKFVTHLHQHEALLTGSNGAKWAAALIDGRVKNVSIFDDEARIGDERLSFAETLVVKADRDGAGFATVRAEVRTNSDVPREWRLLLPEKLAFALCEEWEIRRTRFNHATATLPTLYAEFNNAKKFNLLSALFSDIVTLNRQLDEGIAMTDLIGQLERKDAGEFFKDEKLREATIAKILTLSMVIPQIKRNFEQWVALYPYYWANQDAEWIGKIFGAEVGSRLAPMQRKRKVPLVRQAVRSAQAGMQRALTEIEVAIRELERSLARSELQKQAQYQFWQNVPLAARGLGTIASAAVLIALAGPVAPVLLGGGVLMLSTVAAKVASNKIKGLEDAALFQRTAKSTFPWWEVFMRTLGVSLYETAQLIDEENVRAMKLDRQLFDKLPPAKRTEVLQRISSGLRERILAEKRNGFAELLEGSGFRVAQVVEEIQGSLRREAGQFETQFLPNSGDPEPTTTTELCTTATNS